MEKLKLKSSQKIGTVLSDEELKHVYGGTGSGSNVGRCSVHLTCPDGKELSITDCIGSCTSSYEYIKCTGPNHSITKLCDGSVYNS